MATTLQQILKDISAEHIYSTSLLSSSDPEYDRWINIINRMERFWVDAKHGSLLKNSSLTLTAGSTSVTCPTDFKPDRLVLDKGGKLKIGDIEYTYIPAEDRRDYLSTDCVFWILGNDSAGYTLYIGDSKDTDKTIEFDYYSTYGATDTSGTEQEVLVEQSDKTKCPNPRWIVYSTVSFLQRNDDEFVKSQDYESLAGVEWDNMFGANAVGPTNSNFEIEDANIADGYTAIGD